MSLAADILLYEFRLRFSCSDRELLAAVLRHFQDWPPAACPKPSQPIELLLRFERVRFLPEPSQMPVYFSDTRQAGSEVGALSARRLSKDRLQLRFHQVAQVELSLNAPLPGSHCAIDAVVTEQALAHGLLEDVLMTSLAPQLRRQGYYLIHAFAACKDGQSLLLVGESGSGKTTSGLSLLLKGWQLLSNDAILVQRRAPGICALPTPGVFNIRRGATSLLPELSTVLRQDGRTGGGLAPAQPLLLGGSWGESAPVQLILFPHVGGASRTALAPLQRAICLARLTAQSIDRWDASKLPDHVGILEGLTSQALPFTLDLGPDVADLPEMIEKKLSGS